MSDHVYKKIEVVGSSTGSLEEAVRNAIRRAGASVQNMRWFELSELRGEIQDNDVAYWQATIKIGFRVGE